MDAYIVIKENHASSTIRGSTARTYARISGRTFKNMGLNLACSRQARGKTIVPEWAEGRGSVAYPYALALDVRL